MSEAQVVAFKPVPNRGWITLVTLAATLLYSIDMTIANVALPHMQAAVSASPEQITWALTSYIIAAAITTPLTGWLVYRLGRKQLFLVSIAGFTITSMACGLATTLPDLVLLPEQQAERYALHNQNGSIKREVQQFMDWSAAPINTERSARYTRAVQSTTLDKVPGKIWGFLGYTAGYFNLGREEISMQLYADPRYVARFVAYIKARDVGIGYIRAHLGLTRKVNDYLQSGAEEGSEVKLHASKMERWLETLEAQLSASIQRVVKVGAPDISVTWEWVEALCDEVLDQVDGELLRSDSISHSTALRVQQALLAALVTGCYCPPCRLHVLQTMIHPRFNGRLPCQDRDCMNGRGCMGNHLQLTTVDPPEGGVGWEEEPAGGNISANNQNNDLGPVTPASMWPYFDYPTTEVSNVIVHHKNDR